MNVLIIGAGSVGIAIAASLCNGGAHVHMLTHARTKRAIDENGISRIGIFDSIFIEKGRVCTFESYAGLPDDFYNYIMITAKTLANDEISQQLHTFRACMKSDCKIIIMQNGWGNEQPFLQYFKPEQLYGARIITGFTRTAPNISKVTVHSAPILFGSLHGCSTDSLTDIVEIINESKLPCELTNELSRALWAKMLYNTTLNPLGAVLDCCYGELYECEYSRNIMSLLIKESFAVMDYHGFKSFWDTAEQYENELFTKLIPATYYHRSSTLQDIERKQKTEIETLNGCLIRLAEGTGIELPNHLFLYRLIKATESKF